MKEVQNKNGNDYRARAEADKQKRLAALDKLLSSSETAASADVLAERFPDAEAENVLPAPISLTVGILQRNLAKRAKERERSDSATHSGHRKRLRESARQDVDLYGLSDVELIELLLSFLIPQKDTNVLAHKLIDSYGSVVGVLCAPSRELMKFPFVTKQVATMLPILSYLCVTHGCAQTKLTSRASAAEFFGLAYLGKLTVGTFAAFLDENFRIIVIEKFDCDNVPKREILSSACKYYAKYVFVARRELDLFPRTYNIAEGVGDLASMLSDMGAKLLDYLIFTDYGYYTVGAPPKDGGWYPMYIFIPAVKCMRSIDMYGAAIENAPNIYVGDETAEQFPDICNQIVKALKCD